MTDGHRPGDPLFFFRPPRRGGVKESVRPPEGLTPNQHAKDLLAQVETIRRRKAAIVDKHEAVFKQLEALETDERAAVETLKRLYYSKSGPPAGTQMASKSAARPAKGDFLFVEVMYKRHRDYYEPALLPPGVLTRPGVVTAVDTNRLDELAATGDWPEVKRAKKEGAWMTPSLSIKRIEEENDRRFGTPHDPDDHGGTPHDDDP